MKLFAKIRNDFQTLTIFVKRFILDVWQNSEHVVNLTLSNLYSGIQGCSIIFPFKGAESHDKHFTRKGLPIFRKWYCLKIIQRPQEKTQILRTSHPFNVSSKLTNPEMLRPWYTLMEEKSARKKECGIKKYGINLGQFRSNFH